MGGVSIHPTAVIDPGAEIGIDVVIGPYSVIGGDVVIGDRTVVQNHVTLQGRTEIGTGNTIGPYTSIGLSAQDRAHRDEPTRVVIGNDNEIREYVSIHRGTLGGRGLTQIGHDNQIMVGSHFGHDVRMGDRCMIANLTTFAGHVQIGSFVVTGGMSGVHQFCRIGDYAMLGGYSAAYQDIPPYLTCTGQRAHVLGLNLIGLERNGFTPDDIGLIQRLYTLFYGRGLVRQQAIHQMQQEIPAGPIRDRFIDFVSETRRGIVPRTSSALSD
jgi:UDP-N-acetylglucosamine acyltransferase